MLLLTVVLEFNDSPPIAMLLLPLVLLEKVFVPEPTIVQGAYDVVSTSLREKAPFAYPYAVINADWSPPPFTNDTPVFNLRINTIGTGDNTYPVSDSGGLLTQVGDILRPAIALLLITTFIFYLYFLTKRFL